MAFLAYMHLALFLALSLSPGNNLLTNLYKITVFIQIMTDDSHCITDVGASLVLHVPALRRRKTEVVRYIVKMYLIRIANPNPSSLLNVCAALKFTFYFTEIRNIV